MVRKKLLMKKIDNPSSRQVTYSKRRDGIVKKATELSVLCGTDVGLLMFSPTGRLTCFASNGRIEDIFLRFLDRPNELRGGPIENAEVNFLSVSVLSLSLSLMGKFTWVCCDLYVQNLSGSLKNLKYEGEIMEKIEKFDSFSLFVDTCTHTNTQLSSVNVFLSDDNNSCCSTLEEKLHELNQLQEETQEKIRSYNPDVEKITSVHEALLHQEFLTDAIQRIEQLKGKVLGKHTEPQKPESIEIPALDIKDADLMTEDSVDSDGRRNPLLDDHHLQETLLPLGPHLSIDYLKAQSHWSLQRGGTSQG
ncbi:agamous-like MADS-box protein AGL104 [Corylus avellana]|uniref:agamous-like MADS-box protein AGL104 n=1 Tax=Corylus avellana TaxID=13451 RepID=UPI00286A629A|nr:agamous-like MADS-box protein AGL104 [Corylus avellana]